MEITKIKFDGAYRTIIMFREEHPETRVEKEVKYTSDTKRHEDFEKAREAIVPLALQMLELDMAYAHSQADSNAPSVRLLSATFSNNDSQGFGAVCTLEKDLAGFNAPLILNTPHASEESGDGMSHLPTALRECLKLLIKEAELFIGGKSAQGNLFDTPQDAEPEKSVIAGDTLAEANRIVVESGNASISFIQRELGLALGSAIHIMDELERIGVVSAPNAIGKRTVLGKEGGAE